MEDVEISIAITDVYKTELTRLHNAFNPFAFMIDIR